jgi:hypothetical protein
MRPNAGGYRFLLERFDFDVPIQAEPPRLNSWVATTANAAAEARPFDSPPRAIDENLGGTLSGKCSVCQRRFKLNPSGGIPRHQFARAVRQARTE